MTTPDALAADMIDAHRNGTRFEPQPVDLTRAGILAVQSAVMDSLGDVAGFKVGRSADGPPLMAPIPARYEVDNGAGRRVKDKLGIELEIGFEVLAPLDEPRLPEDLAAHFRPIVALELVDTRLDGPLAQDPRFKFADLQINAGLVKGEALDDWDGTDFDTVRARLTANGEAVLDGVSTVPGGSALANLEMLIANVGDHCGGLKPGQVVITGSICGLPYFEAGTTIEGWIEGLGDVSVILE